MPDKKKPRRSKDVRLERRSDMELREQVAKVLRAREAEHAKHAAKHVRRNWFASLVGLTLIGGGIAVFFGAHHDHAEWVAIVLIVLGGGLFDRQVVTGILRARFRGGSYTGEYSSSGGTD